MIREVPVPCKLPPVPDTPPTRAFTECKPGFVCLPSTDGMIHGTNDTKLKNWITDALTACPQAPASQPTK